MKSRINLWCFSLLYLFSMAAQADLNEMTRIFRQTPQLNRFEVCQGGGCAQVSTTGLTLEQWQQVAQVFKSKAQNAEQERVQIAEAIGVLEQIVGKIVGTETDLAGTFDNSDTPGQMDCNDEAINTTTYMRLLKQAGLMTLHEVEDTRTRNFFFTGWPHTTAVIHEIASKQRYAVDSWFYDNGHSATIVPFEQWKANYEPADSPIGKSRRHASHTKQ